ncbi:DUF3368 domain-containing protein [Methylomonas sp. EFPC3]|uniref:DUF3368 domain-containing protein n=1 Tax=Methylomonas TaxID=416 RepID=UPI0011299A13|nr:MULTISPECIES: DUF3368 domain-containing protein [Methylomonas]TPQ24245.1 hypothetical protein C2U68_20800 [Methylomonas koyamae]WFP49838.1 DUF3368 domain-containing protein [Methylomonas sp. EFPC3]
MAVVIADAGPLIALAKIGQLPLLPALFHQITVTQAVADECLCNLTRDGLLIRQALATAWVQCVANPEPKHKLSKSLGPGEQSSIELALQRSGKSLLILDDGLARKQALRMHLDIVGTAAVLFAGQRKGLLDNAEAAVTQLNQAGYRISASVVAELKKGLP